MASTIEITKLNTHQLKTDLHISNEHKRQNPNELLCKNYYENNHLLRK